MPVKEFNNGIRLNVPEKKDDERLHKQAFLGMTGAGLLLAIGTGMAGLDLATGRAKKLKKSFSNLDTAKGRKGALWNSLALGSSFIPYSAVKGLKYAPKVANLASKGGKLGRAEHAVANFAHKSKVGRPFRGMWNTSGGPASTGQALTGRASQAALTAEGVGETADIAHLAGAKNPITQNVRYMDPFVGGPAAADKFGPGKSWYNTPDWFREYGKYMPGSSVVSKAVKSSGTSDFGVTPSKYNKILRRSS